MSKTDKNKKYTGSSEFIKIIELAVHEGADSITMEYNDGLRVCNWIGTVSIADVFVDPDYEKELIGYIIEAANLEDEPKGSIVVDLHGTAYTINVEEYNHFEESAFKFTFKKENE
jgi:hypothetical protein